MLTFRFEEERVLAPDVDAAFGTEGFVDFCDLGRWCDRITDDAAADVVHDVRHGAVAVDDAGDAGEFHLFHLWSFHDEESNEMEKRSKKLTAENDLTQGLKNWSECQPQKTGTPHASTLRIRLWQ